jgi:hypothetical protein
MVDWVYLSLLIVKSCQTGSDLLALLGFEGNA